MNGVEGIGNAYAAPAGFGMLPPLSGTTTATETMVPMYCSAMAETVLAKTMPAIKSDSGLTYAVPVSRKRSRDAVNPMAPSIPGGVNHPAAQNNRRGSLTFLGEDFSFHFQQQQLEIDRFIAQHVRNRSFSKFRIYRFQFPANVQFSNKRLFIHSNRRKR